MFRRQRLVDWLKWLVWRMTCHHLRCYRHFPRLNCQFTVIGFCLSTCLSLRPVTNDTWKQNNRDCEHSDKYYKMKPLALCVMMHYVFVSELFRLKKPTPPLSHSLNFLWTQTLKADVCPLSAEVCSEVSKAFSLCLCCCWCLLKVGYWGGSKVKRGSPPSPEVQVTQLGGHFFFLGAGAKLINFDLIWRMNNRL